MSQTENNEIRHYSNIIDGESEEELIEELLVSSDSGYYTEDTDDQDAEGLIDLSKSVVDEPSPIVDESTQMLNSFYDLITGLKITYPKYTPTQFREMMSPEELNGVKISFIEMMSNVDKCDTVYINMLIALGTIGIEIAGEDKEELPELIKENLML